MNSALLSRSSGARLQLVSVLIIAATIALAFLTPTRGYAQQTMNAQPLTSDGIALTAVDLGPEWSMTEHHSFTLEDGTVVYQVTYSAPSGRAVRLTTAAATSPELAEAVITFLRYDLEKNGATITSVQSNGFGDGRAFRAQFTDGKVLSVTYLFRVRNLMAFAGYAGPASAGDVESQAIGVARKQEAKLFGFFTPPAQPTPSPMPTVEPTPLPTATPLPAPIAPVATDMPVVQTAPHCQVGEKPQFGLGFATLSIQLGPLMGNPTSCQYSDPSGSGDTLQDTDTGLAIYRVATNTATFTNGSDHWALVASTVVHWTGDALDPPVDAETFSQ